MAAHPTPRPAEHARGALVADVPAPDRVNILGVGVHAVNLSDAVAIAESTIAAGKKGLICVTGVHGIMESQKDQLLKSIINSSLLTVPDGRPTLWLGRIAGYKRMGQVFGP